MNHFEVYINEKPFMSDALHLACYANLVVYDGLDIHLVVRHVPIAVGRNENHIVSRETISEVQWESVREVVLKGMKKIS